MKVLHLTVHKQWFDMIASGEKTEEYRKIKPHWDSRLNKDYDAVRFTNGYGKHRPTMLLKLKSISTGKGNPEWGAPVDKTVYIIKLGNMMEAPQTIEIENVVIANTKPFVQGADEFLITENDLQRLAETAEGKPITDNFDAHIKGKVLRAKVANGELLADLEFFTEPSKGLSAAISCDWPITQLTAVGLTSRPSMTGLTKF